MVRSLPWLTEKAAGSSRSEYKYRPIKRLGVVAEAERHADHVRNTRGKRNLSSSPPPPPPEQEPMRGGLDADDAWIMVEDEFYATAQQYTQHLHHAEYQRMKREVRALNANNIRIIERPVDPRVKPSTQTLKHAKAQHLRKRQAEGLRGVLADRQRVAQDDEEDDPWQQNPTLAGLMQNQDSSRRLAGMNSSQTRPNTGSSSQTPAAPHSSPPELASSPPETSKERIQRIFGKDASTRRSPAHTLGLTRRIAPRSPLNSAKHGSVGTNMHADASSRSADQPEPEQETADQWSPRKLERNRAFANQLAARKKAEAVKAKREALKVEEVPTFLF